MTGFNKRMAMIAGTLLTTGILYSTPAAAQATRTWVSGVGDDANPCSRTAPCKTFAGAISKTATSGEINCLDPAGFGAVTITKSITIDCAETVGGILSLNVNGITVNGAGAIVTLRGVDINGAGGTTGNGVRILQAASVSIEDSNIYNFAGTSGSNGRGVYIEANTGNVQLFIKNTVLASNRNNGVFIGPVTGTTANVELDNVILQSNTGAGLAVTTANGGDSTTTVKNSSLIGGGVANSSGVIAKATAGNAAVTVTDSSISSNTLFGINANGAGALVRVGRSTITTNATGVNAVNGGQVISYGNNQTAGNTVPGTFSSTIAPN